jgi:hypothetical protein
VREISVDFGKGHALPQIIKNATLGTVPGVSNRPLTQEHAMTDVEALRTILRVMMQLECPTTEAIAEATGRICPDCVENYLEMAETLGFVENA